MTTESTVHFTKKMVYRRHFLLVVLDVQAIHMTKFDDVNYGLPVETECNYFPIFEFSVASLDKVLSQKFFLFSVVSIHLYHDTFHKYIYFVNFINFEMVMR